MSREYFKENMALLMENMVECFHYNKEKLKTHALIILGAFFIGSKLMLNSVLFPVKAGIIISTLFMGILFFNKKGEIGEDKASYLCAFIIGFIMAA